MKSHFRSIVVEACYCSGFGGFCDTFPGLQIMPGQLTMSGQNLILTEQILWIAGRLVWSITDLFREILIFDYGNRYDC